VSVPHQDGSLTLAVTHKFPRRGGKIAEFEALFEANNDTLFRFVGDQENVDF
jgi:hypothetical protein